MTDVAPALPDERRRHLLSLLSSEGKLVITELSRRLSISGDTLRRDLQELSEAGLVQRVHGGALPLAPSPAPYAARRETSLTAKREVAMRAVRLIRPSQILLLDGGTTVLEPGDKNVTVNATLDQPLGLHATVRECREQREVAATVSGHAAVSALTFGRTRVSTRHRGVGSCFVDKHQLLRVKHSDRLPPRRSRFGVLLARR